MKKKLFWKFLIAYILIGITSFILISTAGSRLLEKELVDSHSMSLYKEASRIASYQAARYYTRGITLEEVRTNCAISAKPLLIISARCCSVPPSGRLDSS